MIQLSTSTPVSIIAGTVAGGVALFLTSTCLAVFFRKRQNRHQTSYHAGVPECDSESEPFSDDANVPDDSLQDRSTVATSDPHCTTTPPESTTFHIRISHNIQDEASAVSLPQTSDTFVHSHNITQQPKPAEDAIEMDTASAEGARRTSVMISTLEHVIDASIGAELRREMASLRAEMARLRSETEGTLGEPPPAYIW